MSASPPIAKRVPHSFELHGETVEDPYHWLKDPGYPEVTDTEVLDYLKAENAWFEQWMAPLADTVEGLFEEIKARQPLEDESVPYRRRGFWYRWRFERDAEYRIWELGDAESGPWSTLLSEPELAAAHEYFRLGALSVSPDGALLAYSSDTDGSERFNLQVVEIATGEVRVEAIANTIGGTVWSADSQQLFYTVVNDQWRPWQVRRRSLLDGADELVYEEQDVSFFVRLDSTQDDQFVLISAGDHVTNEVYQLPADRPEQPPAVIAPRRPRHEYHVDHRNGVFYIRTNRRHRNFDLMTVAVEDPSEARWQTLVEGDDHNYLIDHLCLAEHVLLASRVDGLDQLDVLGEDDRHRVEFPEPAYSVGFGSNGEFATATVRLAYTSMVTPATVLDYDINARRLSTRKVQEIPSGYDAERFETHRLMVPARDGVRVPVSVVCPKDHPRDGSQPLYLYGYGAYGMAIPPSFSAARLSLLERGFAVAIAHIRGGDDLGYGWYEAGKLEQRTNTFNDFVDVGRGLVTLGWTSAGRMAIVGGSAGGELMGAAVNQAAGLWGAVAAHVPFVDVLNTMCDTSLPLTPIEWPEWGNPIEDEQAFRHIRSYSPYDQLSQRDYPPMLVTAGLNDPRVTYWEPAKYVAKLRTLHTGSAPVLLKTNMGAGHGGKSGRFDSLIEVAEEYAFILAALDG